MRLITLFALVAPALAAFKGFNYGDRLPGGGFKQEADYEAAFNAAKSLPGAPGFNSARLFTTIQGPSQNEPISAIPAALKTDTTLLLGLWCSAGEAAFNNELTALTTAIKVHGQSFVDKVAAISVGSEDLYRTSPTGIQNKEFAGETPEVISGYIKRVREALASTPASKVPIGHVDTWTAWVDPANKGVIDAVDFLGMDAYPYFQTTFDNNIDNANKTFYDAYTATQAAAVDKPVWVTETGWPVVGEKSNQAEPNFKNAERYWKEVQCSLTKAGVNTWWYTLNDGLVKPSFSVLGGEPRGPFDSKPLFDLGC